MPELSITITGRAIEDLELALEQIKTDVAKGCTSGYDRNDSGNYSFEMFKTEEDDDA